MICTVCSSPPDNEEIMKKDSAYVAKAALELYNGKEGTKYVFDEPFLCCCNLLHPLVVLHANFTAREENSDSSDMFFGEAVQYLGGGSQVLNCVKVVTAMVAPIVGKTSSTLLLNTASTGRMRWLIRRSSSTRL
ncbi:unnamed protein product [Linum tenue]|uniref:DUF3615 domain-containing protein n=1 Tax=Linum tenue TaxID=586396 RepID=A0AAV0M196_9ROSI|nr:unnamed protein product [Linum tenue]